MSDTDKVILVDEQDLEIGVAEKLLAHQQAQLHRAFSVFIVRYSQNQLHILLQQRQSTKYHSAHLWTNACCSHPKPGEPVLLAAQRRLKEEMGIEADLHEIGSFIYKAPVGGGLTEHEFDHVLLGTFEGNEIPFNPQEVAAYRWASADTLVHDVKLHPEKYTAWFAQALALVLAKSYCENPST